MNFDLDFDSFGNSSIASFWKLVFEIWILIINLMRISALLNKNNVIKFFLSHFNHSITFHPIQFLYYTSISNHKSREANNKTDPDLKFAHPKILLFFNERKEKRKKKKHVACFRPEERETTVVVRSRPVKMAGKGEKGKGSTSVCIVHDLVLDRKQKFPAYVCDPLFLRLARGNSFPVKRRRDFEIAPCDSSLLHPATLSTPIAHHYTLLFPFFHSLSLFPLLSSLQSVFEAFSFLDEFGFFAPR